MSAVVLHSAIESARPLIETRQHKLTVAIAPGHVAGRGRPDAAGADRDEPADQRRQIYRQSEVRSGCRPSGRRAEIVIKVRDAGMGIPPEQLSRMFELFAQGDRSLARSEGGLGIGLTLARSLAEMHGGSLTATSAGPGTGSEFVVRLPAASSLTAGALGAQAARSHRARGAAHASWSSTTMSTWPGAWPPSEIAES